MPNPHAPDHDLPSDPDASLYRASEYPPRPVRSPESSPHIRFATAAHLDAMAARVSEGGEGPAVLLPGTPLVEASADGATLRALDHRGVPLTGLDRNRHGVVVGSSGSGKTYGVGLGMLDAVAGQTGDSMVWLNARGAAGTQEVTRLVRRHRRGKIRRVVLAPGRPDRSVGMNVLAYARRCGRLLTLVQTLVRVEERGSESAFWDNQASAYFSALLSSPDVESLAHAVDLLNSEKRLRTFAAARRCDQLNAFVSFLDSGNQNAVTVIADMRCRIAPFAADPEARAVMSGADEFDPEVLLRSGERFLLVIEANESEFKDRGLLINLFLSLFFDAAAQVAEVTADRRLPRPVHVTLDEVGNVGVIDKLESALHGMRSRGLSIWLLLQSLEQLARYGREAESVRASLQTQIFLFSGLADVDRAAAVCKSETILTERWDQGEEWDEVHKAWRSASTRRKEIRERPLLNRGDLRTPKHPIFGGLALMYAPDDPPVLVHFTRVWAMPALKRCIERGAAAAGYRTRKTPLPVPAVLPAEAEAGKASGADKPADGVTDTRRLPTEVVRTQTAAVARAFYRGADSRDARRWLRKILKENRKNARLSLRILEEYRARDAGLDDAFRAFKLAGTENVQANLNFYDYLKLKERGAARAESSGSNSPAYERFRQRVRAVVARNARSESTSELMEALAARKRARLRDAVKAEPELVVIDPGRSARERPGKDKRAERKARKRAAKGEAARRDRCGGKKDRKKDRKKDGKPGRGKTKRKGR